MPSGFASVEAEAADELLVLEAESLFTCCAGTEDGADAGGLEAFWVPLQAESRANETSARTVERERRMVEERRNRKEGL